MDTTKKEVFEFTLTAGEVKAAVIQFVKERTPGLDVYPQTNFDFQVSEDGELLGATMTATHQVTHQP